MPVCVGAETCRCGVCCVRLPEGSDDWTAVAARISMAVNQDMAVTRTEKGGQKWLGYLELVVFI